MTRPPLHVIVTLLVLSSALMLGGNAIAQSQDQPDGTLANPLQAQSLDRLTATRDRPLFSPSRRPVPPPPPPVEPAPVVAAPPPPPSVTLFGIVIDGEGARAIIRSGTAKVERVQIGDEIGGWKVSQIEGRKLVLSLDDRFATVTLFNDEDGGQLPGHDGQADRSRNDAVQGTVPQTAEPEPTTSPKRRRSRQ